MGSSGNAEYMGTVASSVSFNMFQFLLVVSLAGLSLSGTPVCNTILEEKCWDEPREQCTTVQKPYTSTYYEDECMTVKVPKVETVPEKKCGTIAEQKCATKYEEVCLRPCTVSLRLSSTTRMYSVGLCGTWVARSASSLDQTATLSSYVLTINIIL